MLNLGTLQSPDLPYVPLPENARRAVLNGISEHGFTALEHFDFISLGENRSVKANILAFAHPIHRTPEYTGITVFNAVNGYEDRTLVELLARSAAPFHIIHRHDKFSLWRCPLQNKVPTPRPIEVHISYDQLNNVLTEYEADLQPRRIIDVKQGRDTFTIFRDIQPLQLSLWAAEVTSGLLVSHFGATVAQLRKIMSHRIFLEEELRDKLVTTLSIQLLGAIILADTGVLGDEIRLKRPSLDTLMLKASKKFERYFRYEMFSEYFLEAEQAYQLLQKICYAGFVPDMLRDLYRTAYSEERRKESGSYDTPLFLTRRIWQNIPVEYLPPHQRVVADMTCGWGSFLVAGYERLSSMNDMRDLSLRDHLYGNDDADFTSQLAGLGLLLSTSEDSWHIDQSDALKWIWLNTHQPNIIVGNPPFEANRKKNPSSDEKASTNDKKRREKANKFLELAIERLAPGGYLAIIMPRSFTVAEASYRYRRDLLEQCDVLELWELPTKVFSEVNVRTVVVFAQKKKGLHSNVRVRTLQPNILESFKHSEAITVTASGLVVDQSIWHENAHIYSHAIKSEHSENTNIMDYKIILSESTWEAIFSHCVTLREYAEIFRGATVGQPSAKKRQQAHGEPELVPWLPRAKGVLRRPFYIDYVEPPKTISYPDGLQWPRLEQKHIFEETKVLVVYAQDPSWGKRVKVAIERKNYYVSDSFWIIVPKMEAQERFITHEVIAAIVSWDVSNAWVIEHMRSPAIPERAMNAIPFPKDLSEEDCKNLMQAILTIESAANANLPEPVEATQTIDFILKRAYHLDDATFTRLRQVKEWDSKPQITLDPPSYSEEANCFISGVVDRVNAAQGTITLWLKGFDELQTVQITPSMPGWMLRPGMAFRTEIPRKYSKEGIIDTNTTAWGTFRPQPYTYMSEEELLGQFTSLLR